MITTSKKPTTAKTPVTKAKVLVKEQSVKPPLSPKKDPRTCIQSLNSSRSSTVYSNSLLSKNSSRNDSISRLSKISSAASLRSSSSSLSTQSVTSGQSSIVKKSTKILSMKDCVKGTITLPLVAKRNLVNYKVTADEALEQLARTTHVRLDRESVTGICDLSIWFPSLTHLYLQHNALKILENLNLLENLSFLILSDNQLQTLQGLEECKNLQVLDVSRNQIRHLQTEHLPVSIEYLFLQGNPCSYMSDYRLLLVKALPNLQELDELDLSIEKKLSVLSVDTSSLNYSNQEAAEATLTPREKEEWETNHSLYKSALSSILTRSRERQTQFKEEEQDKLKQWKERLLQNRRELKDVVFKK